MADSIFTKIIRGEIASHKIYEDDKTFAFLDINPLQPGHTLVVPKTQVAYIWDLPAADYQAVMDTVKKIGKQLKNHLKTQYVGIEVIGVDVPHAHVHIIPFNTVAQFKGQAGRPAAQDHSALAEMAKKLAF